MARTTLEKWNNVGIPEIMFRDPERIRLDVSLLIQTIIEHVERKTNG